MSEKRSIVFLISETKFNYWRFEIDRRQIKFTAWFIYLLDPIILNEYYLPSDLDILITMTILSFIVNLIASEMLN
jgi:hypothetical protein